MDLPGVGFNEQVGERLDCVVLGVGFSSRDKDNQSNNEWSCKCQSADHVYY